METPKQLLHAVQAFFQDYLASQRGLSPHTVMAYRDTLKLVLHFVSRHTGKPTAKLTFSDLRAEAILAFLEELEQERHNSIVTRNLRLAALRTFFRYLVGQDPTRAGQYQRVIAIPIKQSSRSVMPYLEVSEVKAILDSIDPAGASGQRDYALLSLLYNTGARVQEVCDLEVKDLRLHPPPLVTLTGKGRKTRQVPLWPATVTVLQAYLERRGITRQLEARLFVNARGDPLGRFGICHILKARVAAASAGCPSLKGKRISPHTFRHTTAMHLLQAGVDLAVIKSWLGHVNLATTHAYVEIDLEMKRKALSACTPVETPESLRHLVDQHRDIISWLESL